MRYTDSPKGSATILTLLIAAVIITVGVGFNWLVKEHIKAAEGLKSKTEAMLHARSTYEGLLYCILSGTINRKEILLHRGEELLGLKEVPINGREVKTAGGVTIKVQDSNGMISLSSPDPSALKRLIALTTGEDKRGTTIIDSYLDWIDQDDLVRLHGAEKGFYRSLTQHYEPRNYPIQYIEEFSLIKGMDKEVFDKLSMHVTLLPSTGFNPNSASLEVLMAYLDIDRPVANTLMDYISKKPVTSDPELFALAGRLIERTEGINFYPSRFFDILIGAGSPKTLYSIRSGLDVRPLVRFPYSVVYWKEQ